MDRVTLDEALSSFGLLMEVHDAEITAIVPNYFVAGFG